MNMQPIIQTLSSEDFKKMLASCHTKTERFPITLARFDSMYQYHVDIPKPDKEQ